MNIIFFGSPSYSCKVLESLLANKHVVQTVVFLRHIPVQRDNPRPQGPVSPGMCSPTYVSSPTIVARFQPDRTVVEHEMRRTMATERFWTCVGFHQHAIRTYVISTHNMTPHTRDHITLAVQFVVVLTWIFQSCQIPCHRGVLLTGTVLMLL